MLCLVLLTTGFILIGQRNRRLNTSLDRYDDNTESTDTYNYRYDLLDPIAFSVFSRIKITGFLGYISQEDVDAYIEAIDAILKNINFNHFDIAEDRDSLSPEQINLLTDAIGNAIKELLITPSYWPLTLSLRQQISPKLLLEKADEIAGVINKNKSVEKGYVSVDQTSRFQNPRHAYGTF